MMLYREVFKWLVNSRHAVVLSVCMFVKSHLTSGASVHPENAGWLTDYRSQMDKCGISCKVNNDTVCFQLQTPTPYLKQAKSVTLNYNLAHSSKVL